MWCMPEGPWLAVRSISTLCHRHHVCSVSCPQHPQMGVSGLRAQLSSGWESVTVASAPAPAPVTMLDVAAVDHLGPQQGKHRGPEAPIFSQPVRSLQWPPPACCSSIGGAAARRNCLFKLFWIPGHAVLLRQGPCNVA